MTLPMEFARDARDLARYAAIFARFILHVAILIRGILQEADDPDQLHCG